MITYFVAFLCALIVSTTLTLVVRNLAHRFGWVDRANTSRKIHSTPIPRLGGVAIVGGFFAPLAALLLVDSSVGDNFLANPSLVVGLFVGGLVISVLGLYDDFKGSSAGIKFLVQFAVAAGLFGIGFRVESIANPFGAAIPLGVLAFPFTVLWIVGVVNAVNLIDGLDGLAGGVAFFGVATNLVLALVRGDILMCLLMAALAGAVLGFLIFNFNPASIFMGDTGSMFLGFVLAAVAIKTSAKSGTAVAMLVPVISMGLPIMDTLIAMVRRSLLGRPMFSADKEHIHHRLMSRLVLSHRAAVLVLYGLCCLFTLTSLALAYANSTQSALLLSGVGVVVFVLMRKLGYLSLNHAGAVSLVRRRNIQLRSLVKDMIEAIAEATTLQALWEAARPIADALHLARLEIRFDREVDGLVDGVSFETQRPAGTGLPLNLHMSLVHRERSQGKIHLSWRDGRSEVDRDEELALELIADSVAEAAARIAGLEEGRLSLRSSGRSVPSLRN